MCAGAPCLSAYAVGLWLRMVALQCVLSKNGGEDDAWPLIFHLIVLLRPFFGVAAYIAGLTDQDNSSMFGKFCIFIFAAWAGSQNDGVVVGLVVCGIVLSTTSQAAVLMQVCGP